MGKQKNIRLRGTVGNIIYYQWNNIDCIRMAPARVRQTDPTKKEAVNFGVAVKKAAVARYLFRKIVDKVPPGRSFVHTTDSAFRSWLRTAPLGNEAPVNGISFFNGLSFNSTVDFDAFMRVPVQVSRCSADGLQLQWPGFNPLSLFKAPKGTSQITVKYLAATIDMHQQGRYYDVATEFTIPYTDTIIPAGRRMLNNVTAPGHLVLVAVSLDYYRGSEKRDPVTTLSWKPSGIIASFYN